MASEDDVHRLVVNIEASTKKFENAMSKALSSTQKQLLNAENQMARFKKTTESALNNMNLQTGMLNLTRAAGALGVALSANEVLNYSKAWTNAQNSLTSSGVSADQLASVMDRLFNVAQAQGAPVGDLVQLYSKLTQVQGSLGATSTQIETATAGVGTALRVAGAGSAQAQSAILQFAQALQSGNVQANEFNSIAEAALPILQAVAAGSDRFGGSVGRLRQEVLAGNVTSQEFFASFLKGLPTIEKMASNALPTLDQSVTRVSNAMTRYVGESDQAFGVTATLTSALNKLADNFNYVADPVMQLAGLIAAGLLGRSLGPMVQQLGVATVAVGRFITTLRSATAIGAASSAIAGMTLAAGPIGPVVGVAAAAAFLAFSSGSREAGIAASNFEQRLVKLRQAAEQTNKSVSGVGQDATKTKTVGQLNNDLAAGQSRFAKEVGEIQRVASNELKKFQNRVFGEVYNQAEEESRRILQGYLQEYRDGYITLERFRQKVAEIAQQDPSIGALVASTDVVGYVNSTIDAFAKGEMSAGDFQNAIAALDDNAPSLSPIVNAILSIADAAGLSSEGLRQIRAELAALGGASASVGGSYFQNIPNDRAAAQYQRTSEYLNEARELASLSQQELENRRAIDQIKQDAKKRGVDLTDAQAGSIAANQAAQQDRFANERRAARGATNNPYSLANVEADLSQEIAQMQALSQAQGMLTTSGSAAEIQVRLLQAAILSGVPITDALAQKFEQTALRAGQMKDSIEAAQASSQQMMQLQQTFAQGLEDAFMSIIDGSGNAADAFKNMAKQILAQIVRMQVQSMVSSIFGTGATGGAGGGGFLGSLLGGLFGRASGGPVNARQPYVVGESGREMFVPNQAGRIIPAKALRGGGGGSAGKPIINVINQNGSAVTTQTRRSGGRDQIDIIVSEVNKRLAEGQFDKSMRSRFGVGARVVER